MSPLPTGGPGQGKGRFRVGRPTRGQLLAAASAIFYALQNLATRLAAPGADPFVITLFVGIPTVMTGLVLTMASRGRREKFQTLWNDRRGGGRLILAGLGLSGILMYAAGNPIFVRALAIGGVVVASPASNTVVIWSALFAAAFLGERLHRAGLIGIGVFLGGVILLAWGQGRGTPVGPGWYWAIPLAVTSGLFWSSGAIGTRYALGRGMDAMAILAAYGVAGLGVVAAVVVANGHLVEFVRSAASTPEGFRVLVLVLLTGLFNLGAQLTLTLAFATEPVARASVLNSSSVAIVAVLGHFVLGETLNLPTALGVAGAFTGVALVQGQKVKGQPSQHREATGTYQPDATGTGDQQGG